MPCPWYKHGMCTSPKVGEPTDAVVNPIRCGSDSEYKSCTYYVEPSATMTSDQKAPRRDRLRLYAPIHALPPNTAISCPEATIIKLESGAIAAYCKVLNRALTKYEVELCNKYWRDCPYKLIEHH